MKILVFSDSHSSLRFMRRCIEIMKPDSVIHLGDHYDDAQVLSEENPGLRFHCVPGNCDRYRCPEGVPQMLGYPIGGVRMMITHGHNHHVKMGLGTLLADARRLGAQIVLYGHTHQFDCHREDDGLLVLNPGSCGHAGGSAGWICVEEGNITLCRGITEADLEEMV